MSERHFDPALQDLDFLESREIPRASPCALEGLSLQAAIARTGRPTDPVQARLPRVFRVQSIARFPDASGKTRSQAKLFHEQASLQVEWLSQKVNVKLTAGRLVSVAWCARPLLPHPWAQSEPGIRPVAPIRIDRLVLLERPEAEIDLFRTVPPAWVRERELLKPASELWESLSRPLRHLFNAIFWDGNRFERFLCGPSSMTGHHADRGGNFRHTIEVARIARRLADGDPRVSLPLLLAAALLHDAGKADEYQLRYNRYRISDRGALIGHRQTVVEWIAAARATCRLGLPEEHYLALIHLLTSTRGAPAWLEVREPAMIEAHLLSSADRLSGQRDLIERNAPRDSGFGNYHAHLRSRPYVLAQAEGD